MPKKSTINSEFMKAVQHNDIDAAAHLLSQGADPNCVDSVGYSPLITAAIFDYSDLVKLLVERGANKRHADAIGWTARTHADFNMSYNAKKMLAAGSPVPKG